MENNKTQWEFGLSTHEGLVKEVNEDKVFLRLGAVPNKGEVALALVADGMGGTHGGGQASKYVKGEVKSWWNQQIYEVFQVSDPLRQVSIELMQLFHRMNVNLVQMGTSHGIKLGTTLTILTLYQGQFLITHIGDSRVHQCKYNGDNSTWEMIQLTEDHTWVAGQVKKQRMSSEEARNHPKRHVLVGCLGITQGLTPFQTRGVYPSLDLFLLSSDGFYSMFSDKEIIELLNNLLRQNYKLQDVSERLVELALERGATDNVSVLLIKAKTKNKMGV
jgi:serine/threonine protein phosphatase PrpC